MSLNLDLINRGSEGELVLVGRLDSITSEEAGMVFNDLTERFDSLILNMKEKLFFQIQVLWYLVKVMIFLVLCHIMEHLRLATTDFRNSPETSILSAGYAETETLLPKLT